MKMEDPMLSQALISSSMDLCWLWSVCHRPSGRRCTFQDTLCWLRRVCHRPSGRRCAFQDILPRREELPNLGSEVNLLGYAVSTWHFCCVPTRRHPSCRNKCHRPSGRTALFLKDLLSEQRQTVWCISSPYSLDQRYFSEEMWEQCLL